MSGISHSGMIRRCLVALVLVVFVARLARSSQSLKSELAVLQSPDAGCAMLLHQSHTPAAHPTMDDVTLAAAPPLPVTFVMVDSGPLASPPVPKAAVFRSASPLRI